MYYSNVEIDHVATSFSPARTDLALKLLRLPEIDKNMNVEQQKALIFQSDTCKYDVILGA
jgi:hypothetical protein